MATLATPAADRAAIEAFRRDVLEVSMTTLVLVDFWAEWCGPCKTLTPILERVVAGYNGRVALVKIDIDKNQLLAGQFRIQSVPTVYAFLGGQPVDGFAGAVGERELKAFIDRLLAATPPAGPAEDEDLTPLVEAGLAALADGATDDALRVFLALAEEAPDRTDVMAGLARALVAAGRLDEAEAALGRIAEADRRSAEPQQAQAALDLARSAGPAGDLARAKAAADAAPADMDAQFAYANALVASGDRDSAADRLLQMIGADPAWNEGAARARLLQLFEAVGVADPWVMNQRRRLSAMLFR